MNMEVNGYKIERGVNLSGADFSGANLSGADLFGANLTNTILTGANLFGVDITGTNFKSGNLTGAHLAEIRGATGVNMTWATLPDETIHDESKS